MLESERYSLFGSNSMIEIIPTFFKTYELADETICQERKGICEKCDHLQMLGTCAICHCMMFVKTKFIEAKCPIGKW